MRTEERNGTPPRLLKFDVEALQLWALLTVFAGGVSISLLAVMPFRVYENYVVQMMAWFIGMMLALVAAVQSAIWLLVKWHVAHEPGVKRD